ncbi:hypothetical protein [Streptomyces sp. NPDC056387]|uniref:hypothetical protein n=1 Tax=Streptomyces sp. NPDC056387 TaxID=3345803 RepID=UPI0035D567E4
MPAPGQVVTYPWLLPAELWADWPTYQFDLSIPPGSRAGGCATWNMTDTVAMDWPTCAALMELLLTLASSEWDGGSVSWMPLEERDPGAAAAASPPGSSWVAGVSGTPSPAAADPGHPHLLGLQ